MPVYNGEQFIRAALDSLLKQTFKNFELIISDNASTDNTELICREYLKNDSRIRYFKQDKNLGAANNFQFVLNKAKGKYFMWAAHDDLWKKDFILKCVSLLRHDNLAIAAITRSIYNKSAKNSGDSPLNSPVVLFRIAKFLKNPGPNSRFYSVYKIKFLKNINFSDYDYHAGDWAFIYDMLFLGRYIRDENYVGFIKRSGGAGSVMPKIESSMFNNIFFYFPLKRFCFHIFHRNIFLSLIFLPLLVRLNYMNYKYISKLR